MKYTCLNACKCQKNHDSNTNFIYPFNKSYSMNILPFVMIIIILMMNNNSGDGSDKKWLDLLESNRKMLNYAKQ